MMAESNLSAVPEHGEAMNSPHGDLSDPALSYDDEDDKSIEAVKPWDEGGPSDCGYSDTVHSTLMTVGQTVHVVLGTPGTKIASLQTSIGNWFQELSYATRDIWRGEGGSMQQDAANAIKTVMTGQLADEDDDVSDCEKVETTVDSSTSRIDTSMS